MELTDQILKLDYSIDHTSDTPISSPLLDKPSEPFVRQVKNRVQSKNVSDLVPLNFLVGVFIYAILIGVSMVG